jgi:hypothetical protein
VLEEIQGGNMELSPRQRTALTSICDTFFPAANGAPSASELGVVDALLGAVAANPREAERRQLTQLLGLWDTPLLTALGGGGLRRFSALGQAERERILLSWCDSRLPQRRAAFQALRKGALLVSYMLPPRWFTQSGMGRDGLPRSTRKGGCPAEAPEAAGDRGRY